ncbi:AfsR/SARP family transcriptional regulator [Streptomyces caatingaensis]|uniref:AfsR/SARP family transcriptional regulator n=1 Tax=Streptomyces caatingaensis TaxID=1678637 RepID=UPI00099D5B82|nr:AfsR/SARP family transcriptional regulator [Streptomyces caatingaensis]
MEFRVLGPLEILDGTHNIAPTAPKPRQVIALLLMRRNSLVQTSELIDELWEENPPASAMTTLQTYIYKLRKILVAHGTEACIRTRPGGYVLTVPDSRVDLHAFEDEALKGKALLENKDPLRAADTLRRALDRWRGSALVDVVSGALLSSYITRLEEFRGRTLDLRIEADLQLGRHQELVSELKSLVLSRPLHEHVHASLMIALHRSGRRHEALEVYQELRRSMIDNLGLEPGQRLKALHQALLSEEPVGPPYERQQTVVAAADGREAAPPRTVSARIPVPAQLPPDLCDFTGRAALVGRAPLALAPRGAGPSCPTATPVAVITGMPGVGKTALAVHMAHTVRPHFEDGQLYADLRGSTGAGRDPADVLHGFLRALGLAESQVPEDLEERCKLFRSTTVGRKLLVVLDDAASLADARLLLPGGPRCAVILTSRRRLYGPGGAWHISLDAMEPAEGRELLARIVGAARVGREPAAATRLVEVVGALPLAVRCIGGRLGRSPGLSLTTLVEQLIRSSRLLDELRLGELDVRSLYDSSYDRLNRVERSVFRLLSLLPHKEFATEEVVELLGSDSRTVERFLQRYVDRHLIGIVPAENETVHYTFPGLTRVYARERLVRMLAGHDGDGAGDLLQPALAAADDRLEWVENTG